jgi:hypothetical protein
MNGILQPMHHVLQVRDPRLERPEFVLTRTARGRHRGLIGLGSTATKLPDPSDQPLTLAHTSPPTGSRDRHGPRRIAPALLVSHSTNHQRAALDLLADQRELLRPLLLGPLTRALHAVQSVRTRGRPARADRCWR